MNWETRSKLSHQEVAEQVLQIYTKALQDQKNLKSILSEYSVLDYFGKYFYGQENVSSHLIANLLGSNYDLSSLSVNDQPTVIQWDPVSEPEEKTEQDLGVSLVSPPKLIFPGLTFSTPVRSISNSRERSFPEASFKNETRNVKLPKREADGEQSRPHKKSALETGPNHVPVSPETIQTMFPNQIRYLTAYGTIRYPKRVLPTMDPKKIKHNLITLRDRFCQLHIGFQCDENNISVTNCKIWKIKYSVSSRVTPRNLLKMFNEVD